MKWMDRCIEKHPYATVILVALSMVLLHFIFLFLVTLLAA